MKNISYILIIISFLLWILGFFVFNAGVYIHTLFAIGIFLILAVIVKKDEEVDNKKKLNKYKQH